MEKAFSTFVSSLRISLFLCLFAMAPTLLHSQCDCGNNIDINPGAYWNRKELQYDAEGFVTGYIYKFQFPCIATLDPFGREYRLIYREKGTNEWTVVNIYLLEGENKISVGPFEPCKTYELRITCPLCPESEPNCEAEDQLQNYFNDPNNTYQNVSRIWEICYSPIDNQPINNLKVISVNTGNNSVTFKWDHLPGPATYELHYKKGLFDPWIDLGTTDQYEYQLDNLESCGAYTFRVQGFDDNCCGGSESQSAIVDFVVTDCMSNIESVDAITGNSAHVSWSPFPGATPVDYQVEWWTNNPSNPFTATTTATDYTITGLNPNTQYYTRVRTNCGAPACPIKAPSQRVKFSTTCELREPNNDFQTAAPVAFDANHGNNNIAPAGDIDFFKFTPTTCDLIEIKVDHPDLDGFPHPDPAEWVGNDLPYSLYDQNFQEIPKNDGYSDPEGRFHQNIHRITPGQEYYLAVKGLNSSWTNLNCYTINAFPCWGCDELSNNYILGESHVNTTPFTGYYSLAYSGYHIQWSVTGPAQLQIPNPDFPANVQLDFTGTGTVTLTALLRRCDGSTATFEKVITVSDECNITGSYSTGGTNRPLSQTTTNYFTGLGYLITLNIPAGTSFNIYAESGDVVMQITGNQILVYQISFFAKLRIVLVSGPCAGSQASYVFSKSTYPNEDPIEWLVSPNPTSGFLQIEPVVAANASTNELPERVDIRLFDQYSTLQVQQEASTSGITRLDISNLMPGNYTLHLVYGSYARQFIIVKQ